MDHVRQVVASLAASLAALLMAALPCFAAPAPDEPASFEDVTFLLPAGARVGVRWVLPPSSQSSMGAVLSVGADGNPVLASSYKSRIINPVMGYMVTLEPYSLSGITHLDNGVMLLAVGNDIGLLAAPAKRTLSKEGVPVAGFQPMFSVPVKEIEGLAGVGDTLYVAGSVPGTDRHALFMLRMVEGAGLLDLQRLFESPAAITAIAGDGEAVFAAIGKSVVRIAVKDGGVMPLYTHPSEKITGLAQTPAGLMASTGKELVLVGPHGSLEIMRSGGHVIDQHAGSLYVLFSDSMGVIALDNLADLARFNLDVRQAKSGEVPLPLSVTGVRFFESGPPPYARRDFAESFDRKTVRRIVGQIDYRVAAAPKMDEQHTVTVSWFEPTGGRLTSVSYPVTLGPKAGSGGQILASIGQEAKGEGYIPRSRGEGGMTWRFGKDALGARYPGRYRVTVQVDGIAAGEWGFTLAGPAKPIEAMAYNDPAMLRTLLGQGLNPQAKDEDGDPLLHLAIVFGSTEMVAMLLDAGADPNQTDKEGKPALAKTNPVWAPDWQAKAEFLLRRGANVNAASDKDGQPLLYTMTYHPEYTVWLLDHGANINARDIHFKRTAAQELVGFGFCKEPVLSALVKRGANISTTTDDVGRTPLSHAIYINDVNCVELLLSKGVSQDGVETFPRRARSAYYLALKNLAEATPESISRALRVVNLFIARGVVLRPDEGGVMFRGNVPAFLDRAALTRVLRDDEEALKEAERSQDVNIQELALQTIPYRVRDLTPKAGDGHRLYEIYRHCREGYRLIEGKYLAMQMPVKPDTAPAGARGKQPAGSHLGAVLIDRDGEGAYVQKVTPGGAGQLAGLTPGDILVSVDGQKMKNAADIVATVARAAPGTAVRVDVLRGDAPTSRPDLVLACGVLESAVGEKGRAEMNLNRWLAANPNAPEAPGIRDLLAGRALPSAASWGFSSGRPGSAGCSMQQPEQ